MSPASYQTAPPRNIVKRVTRKELYYTLLRKRQYPISNKFPPALQSTNDDDIIIPPMGIKRLIELTNQLMPQGLQAVMEDIAEFFSSRKAGN